MCYLLIEVIINFLKISIQKLNLPGRKEVQIGLNTPLNLEYTGKYACTAQYPDKIETISWYIYFYPNDGKLFLKCPLLDKLPKCLVFFRNNIPFRVPCKSLHPKIEINQFKNVNIKLF